MIVGHIGGGAVGGYQIEKSLRFRASASASLSFTPGSAGNRKQLMRRFRIKRGTLGTLQVIHSAGTASIDRFYFNASDQLCLDVLGTARLVTNALFRDPSAHMVDVGFFLDVANGTAALRAGIIVDGVEVSSYATDGRASITNTDTNWNNTVVQYIGRDNAGNYFDGYISEPVGATTVTAYSVFNPDNLRVPVAPVCTYGTNGFYLPFNDGTNTTELCRDRSGNGNDWTANNISLTAGATYDWMDDTPTNNFAVLNPLDTGGTPPTRANLELIVVGATERGVRSSSAVPTSGLFYAEAIVGTNQSGATDIAFGLVSRTTNLAANPLGIANGWLIYGTATTNITRNGTSTLAGTGVALVAGDILQLAIDIGNNRAWLGKNNTWFNGSTGTDGNPSTGANPTVTFSAPPELFVLVHGYSSTINANFGQRPFAYAPPTGFKALCTKNRPLGGSITTSGSFTGNANADGPFVWLNGDPVSMTINGNAVTWGTHADRTAGGFKVRTSSASYNASGANNYVVTITGNLFGDEIYAPNTAKGNP